MPTPSTLSIPQPDIATTTKTTSGPVSKPLALSFLVVLFGIAALVYLGTTGALPIMGRDEPRYVQIGRVMLDSGDWVTPRLGGFTWFEKPVLLYWMVGASFGVFGVSEWAARLGPALCGLASAALVWWAVRPVDERWARWSALALLSSGGMLAFSHIATFDIVLTACLTLAMGAWWQAQIEPERASRFLALFWVGVGLAFLAKGLVAFILPLGTIGLYALLRRERVRLGWWWGLPLALLVSLVWYGPVIAVNGEKFINIFFIQHHFERFTSDKYKHHQPFWFYLEMLPLILLPWTPFLVGALWDMRRAASGRGAMREPGNEAGLKVFALAWMVVPVAFFSISGSKLPGYILPSLPAAAILIGAAVSAWTNTLPRERLVASLAAVMLFGTGLLTTSALGVSLAEKEAGRSMFQVAHERGLGHLRMVSFSTTLRTAEFYGAGSLLYDKDGDPLRLEKASELKALVQNEPILVLVKKGERKKLAQSNLKISDVAQSGSLSLILVQR